MYFPTDKPKRIDVEQEKITTKISEKFLVHLQSSIEYHSNDYK